MVGKDAITMVRDWPYSGFEPLVGTSGLHVFVTAAWVESEIGRGWEYPSPSPWAA